MGNPELTSGHSRTWGSVQGKEASVLSWPSGLVPAGLGAGAPGGTASGRGWQAALPNFLSFPPRGSQQGTDLPRAAGPSMEVKPEGPAQGNLTPAQGVRLGGHRAQRGRWDLLQRPAPPVRPPHGGRGGSGLAEGAQLSAEPSYLPTQPLHSKGA